MSILRIVPDSGKFSERRLNQGEKPIPVIEKVVKIASVPEKEFVMISESAI